MSTSRAPARPIMSAPTPLAGSSTRCGIVCNSPITTSAAASAEVPGQEPIPVAVAKALTGQPYWIGRRRRHAAGGESALHPQKGRPQRLVPARFEHAQLRAGHDHLEIGHLRKPAEAALPELGV